MIDLNILRHIDTSAAGAARARYRNGTVEPTSGVAPGFTQANMIVLPRDWAFDFLLYAQRNPKACPVLDVSDPGSHATVLANGADLRKDVPLYRIWRDGELAEETPDATAAWAEYPDLVSFLIGCSFTFETPMLEAGIEIRHITDKSNVPMYLTNRACRPAGACMAIWSSRCGRSLLPGLPMRQRSRDGFPPFTALPSMSAHRQSLGLPISTSPISEMPSGSSRAKCRSSGPAA